MASRRVRPSGPRHRTGLPLCLESEAFRPVRLPICSAPTVSASQVDRDRHRNVPQQYSSQAPHQLGLGVAVLGDQDGCGGRAHVVPVHGRAG